MDYLNDIKADYEVHNKGYQLNFYTPFGVVAFYPSTNKWVCDGKTYFGNAESMVNWVSNKFKHHDWVKRLGQWHLYESGSTITICGVPMLGNNYSRHILKADREKCKECWEGIIC